ncbi:hypothetical protein LTR09_004766 [Extremus antarcticus]|uniref:Uncharacterized protein n=1 Tax=Extremus antarcticus TaxID=702011 RepID=A0AAJ0DH29_9PEZI|nr:hypothetical protein LTR09_004766 [Extremus antarcticus]
MRLRRRPTPTELVHRTSNDGSRPFEQTEVPLKAQGLLGTNNRQNLAAPRIDTPEPLRELLRADQKSLATFPEPREGSRSITPTGKHAMPWPGAQPSNWSSSDVRTTSNTSGGQYGLSRHGSGQSVRPNQFYSEQKPSVESVNRGHYEPTKQPLYVSQQTSASAVRDMALRKGSPTIGEIASSPPPGSKPLKSAMKQPRSLKDGEGSKRSKKLDVMSLFPQPKPATGPMLSPAKYTHSPSAVTNNTDYFPEETVYAQVRRQGPNGRFETYKDTTPSASPLEPVNARGLPRVKIFDPDIYDETKTHKRKPPKGIQNWFDGFYISSDDEDEDKMEKTAAVELPAEPSRPSPKELLAGLSPYSGLQPALSSARDRPDYARRRESLLPTLQVQPSARRREHRSNSDLSIVNGTATSAVGGDAQSRLGDGRLAHSQLDTESVLALSSESDDARSSRRSSVRESRQINEASATRLQRPAIPPRKVHSKNSLTEEIIRKSTSTAQTSGSIPIRLTDSMEIPPVPTPRKVQSRRESEAPLSPPLANSTSPLLRSQPASRSGKDNSEMQSAAGETTSSAPTDASHLMAVTDEEMMLLELMRQKRAAMQKNSFAEGYRLALKQEEEHLAKKRSSAHSNALKMLKLREEGKLTSSRADSRAGSPFSDESREQRERYSMIRKGSVDKNFRLGRFLAQESLTEETRESGPPASLARLERFLVMKPSLLDAIQDSRPVSGTEIEAEIMTEQDDDTFDEEGYTIDEDDVLDEQGRIIQPGAPSVLQRLIELGAPSPEESRPSSVSPLADDSEVETPNDILSDAETRISGLSQVLTAAENFPTPPGVSSEKPRKRLSLLLPPLSDDESLLPDISARSQNRTPLLVDGRRTRSPRTPRPAQSENSSNKPTPESSHRPLPAVSKFADYSASHSLGVDFMSLELPPTIRSGSPSLSTSRASPLTPTFAPAPHMDKSGIAMSASDGSSFRDLIDMSSPEPPTRMATRVAMGSARATSVARREEGRAASPVVQNSPVPQKRPSKKVPPKIDTTEGKSLDRITSMSSITSAGEDVLAAWAELGGGGDALAARRRGW